jgi:hypothetical protein
MGFMTWAVPLSGCHAWLYWQARGADKSSQSKFYYRRPEGPIRAKGGKGEPAALTWFHELPRDTGRDLLMGVRRLIAAGKSHTNLTYFAHDFRTDLLIHNELVLECTPFGASKIFSFSRFS